MAKMTSNDGSTRAKQQQGKKIALESEKNNQAAGKLNKAANAKNPAGKNCTYK